MKIISFLLLFILIVLGISFAVLNSDPVTVHYYLGTDKFPLSLVMAACFGIGFLIGLFMVIITVIKYKTQKYRLKKRLKLAEKEIENLRTLPIKGET